MRARGDRLPFRESSFAAIVVIRVLHRIAAPERFLGEIRRVLARDGTLVLSFSPRPSLKTLQFDVLGRVRYGRHSPTLTFSSSKTAARGDPGLSGWIETRSRTLRTIRGAGFEVEEIIGTGLEDLAGVGLLPSRFFVDLSRAVPAAWCFPTWFVRLRAT